MGSEWQTEQLGDFIEVQTGFPFQSIYYSEEPDGIRLLRGDNLIQGTFRWDNVKKWSTDRIIEKHRSYELSEGDVVLAMDRPWIEAGLKTAQIKKTDLPCLLVQRVARLRSRPGLSQDFLRYLISSYGFTEYVKQIQTGTAVPHISAKQIQSYVFSKPPVEIQERIGSILRSLDDKIELNREINITLEAMAQALFKSWFVDFDPVIDNALAAGNPIPEELTARAERRAKAAQQPSPEHPHTLPATIRQQFPDRFVFTETMGWMPEGWEVKQFGDLAKILMGQSPKGDTYNDLGAGLPLINGPVEFGYYFAKKMKWTTSPTKLAAKGDLIVCVRGSTTGRYVKSDGEYCLGRGVCAIRAKYSQEFVNQTYLHHREALLKMATGSTFPNWSGPTLNSFMVLRPTSAIVSLFDKLTMAWVEKLEANVIQTIALTDLRDILLPKLLSGQLRIPEAEQQVAEVI